LKVIYKREDKQLSVIFKKRTDLELVEMVILLKQKLLAKDLSLPFARNLKGLIIRAHA
jgi:hypothetical protein